MQYLSHALNYCIDDEDEEMDTQDAHLLSHVVPSLGFCRSTLEMTRYCLSKPCESGSPF